MAIYETKALINPHCARDSWVSYLITEFSSSYKHCYYSDELFSYSVCNEKYQFSFYNLKKSLLFLSDKWPNIFDIMAKHQALYMANQREVETESDFPGLTLVRNFTAAYIIKNNITARNPDMLADVFKDTVQIPNYSNNIEVIDLSFMRRTEVLDFVRAIEESKGIFLYRWGDAPLRYITLALFANATEVLHRQKLKLDYCHRC